MENHHPAQETEPESDHENVQASNEPFSAAHRSRRLGGSGRRSHRAATATQRRRPHPENAAAATGTAWDGSETAAAK